MSSLTLAVVLLTLALGAANGANDVSKGIATLAGAGVARYRTAILWGTGTTLIGAAASVVVSERLTALFSRGIVKMNHQEGFQANLTTAMLVGLGANLGLPMSTTHVATGPSPGWRAAMSPA